ncbi:hypothetical protein [Caldalkalibacillus salinus]|uniref:hypothetical protein n=1 Tax=Caldalkalibacillus salinus TaxID=2803787 RepID=UPI001924D6D8|nr:hypothetical protein [Caldalkalibacillus salinus]
MFGLDSYLQDYSGLLLVALVIVGIFLVRQDQKEWVTVYEASSRTIQRAQARFAFLRNNGVKCRMKTLSPRGMSRGAQANPVMMTTVRVDVHKKEVNKARELLSNFNDDA